MTISIYFIYDKARKSGVRKLATQPVLEVEDIKNEIISIAPRPFMPLYLAVVTQSAKDVKSSQYPRRDQQNRD